MALTLSIREVLPATPRARIVRIDLGGHAFDFAPGQAVVVSCGDAAKRRAYSIANSPSDARALGALELLVGIDTESAAAGDLPLEPGAAVSVDGPFGSFTFPEHPLERDFLFVAGGTGIAPLRAMIRHALEDGIAVTHAALLYSARTPDEFAFADEFRALAAGRRLEFRQTVTRSPGGEWQGARGRIDRAALAPLVHARETLCFVCGPIALVDEIPKLLVELGVSRDRIRIEEW